MNQKRLLKLKGIGKLVVAVILFIAALKPLHKFITGISVLTRGAGEFQRPIAGIIPYLIGYGLGLGIVVVITVWLIRTGFRDYKRSL